MTNYFVAAHALIEKDGTFLLTRRCTTNDYMPLLWDLPGGKVEAGESPEEALEREVMEETSLKVDVGSIVYIHTNTDDMPEAQYFLIVYHCKYTGGEVRLSPEEHDDYRWITAKQVQELPTIHFVTSLLKKGLIV